VKRGMFECVLVSIVAIAASLPAHAEPPLWESNVGTPLNLGDDTTYETTFGAENFVFDFEGQAYSDASPLSISSNGFLSIGGTNGALCCSPTGGGLVSGFPIIAAVWTDLRPSRFTGDVFLNHFADSGGPGTDRLVITWNTILFATNQPLTVQAQLLSDGTIILGYDGYDFTGNNRNVLVGVSLGSASSDPGSSDLSSLMPFASGRTTTIYELFTGVSPAVDFDQTNVIFSPNGEGGFRVTSDLCRPPVWDAQYGQRLDLSDDSTFDTTFGAWNFTFPFDGTTYAGSSVLSISSNGFVSIGGANGDGCCNGDPGALVGDSFGRIAAFWTDLRPNGTGDVYLKAVHNPNGAELDRLVVTWDTVYYETNRPVAAQLELRSDGSFTMGWQCSYLDGMFRDILVGTSPGNGASDPGSTDFSSAIPRTTRSQPTAYEYFSSSDETVAPAFDLAGTNLVFTPNASGGWLVTTSSCQPPIWEPDFGSRLALGDDGTLETTFGTQNFTFPFGGTSFGGGYALSISSNGFVSFGGSNGDGCCDGAVADFLAGAARIAALWTDLYPRGETYLHAFDDWGGPATDRLVVTWDSVTYAYGSSATTQLQLLSNGTIVMSFRCIAPGGVTGNDALVGITPGGGAADPGATDYTAAMPFDSDVQSTIYELFRSPASPDLSGRSFVFEPNGRGGYHVDKSECAAGTVNGRGSVLGRRDVLRVNGTSGTPISRVVTVAQNAPVTVTLDGAPEGPGAPVPYAMWVWLGSSFHPTEYRSGANRIGCLVNPSPFQAGSNPQPFRCLGSPDMVAAACGSVRVFRSPASAPWTVTRPGGFTHPGRFTLQGILSDAAAANATHVSTTNAVVIDVP
jgi:hypothetical protein